MSLRPFELFLQLLCLTFDLTHLFVMFLHGTCRPDTIVEGCVLHAFNDRLTARVDFSGVVRTERGSDRRSVVHPPFQLELSDALVTVPLGPALGDLVPPDVRFVQVMDEVYREFDQEVPLSLVVVRVVQPIVEV
jgi:hypothetical protein